MTEERFLNAYHNASTVPPQLIGQGWARKFFSEKYAEWADYRAPAQSARLPSRPPSRWVAGILLGTAISATTLIPFSVAVSDTIVPAGPIWIYLAIVGAAASLTIASTMVPAWALTRTSAVDVARA
jgi:hypothetical protein